MASRILGSEVPAIDTVKLGSMLFTLVDPHRGFEVAYNRWYERDHYYAGCMIGPWLLAGSRWVAPRACKRLRLPSDSPFADTVAGAGLARALFLGPFLPTVVGTDTHAGDLW